jgi:hypothetical protein
MVLLGLENIQQRVGEANLVFGLGSVSEGDNAGTKKTTVRTYFRSSSA